ncbi:efflux transporter outer membrane subunit [Candidatus Nitrosacidococcus tergens]|uniref:Outer membrane chanel lipoprotein (Modular protein) n=1 Tax=Candidatus Nitrosacidococcus tergens TaxID=553981 RepID=A0A7G1QB40_9GAMM|nr:efflux transporter outer membrane subunit [Candidatus Nitrosacidococcus tergens]CAB1276436.1 Putative outer membrane chanel lipoprotein (modular protein) [Candidatus Nitrosacidococcus tergens]
MYTRLNVYFQFQQRLKSSAILIMVCIALISGCAWLPKGNPHTKFLVPTEIKETVLHERHVDKTFPDWPKDYWWEEFKSPELNDLIVKALADNPGLKAAHERLQAADSLVKVQGAALLPFLEAEAEYTAERLSEHGVFAALNPEVAGITFDLGIINPVGFRYELDFWGKNRSLMEAALGRSLAEMAEKAQVRLELTTSIARSWFHGLATYQQLQLVYKMIEIRKELLQLAKIRVQLGVDDFRSVVEAATELENENKREAGTKDLLEFYQYMIAKLIGRGPDAGEKLFINSTATIPQGIPLPDTIPSGLLTHRPDLAAAMFRAQSAAKMIEVAKTRFLPTIELQSFVGINALTVISAAGGAGAFPGALFNKGSLAYGGGPTFRMPWFEGGRLRAELGAQRSEYDNAVETYNDTLLEALRQIAESLSAWHQTRKILEAHHRLLVSVRGDWHLSQVRLQTGLNDRRDALRQQYAVLNQQYELRGIESDELSAMVEVIEALGGGYPYYIDDKTKELAYGHGDEDKRDNSSKEKEPEEIKATQQGIKSPEKINDKEKNDLQQAKNNKKSAKQKSNKAQDVKETTKPKRRIRMKAKKRREEMAGNDANEHIEVTAKD